MYCCLLLLQIYELNPSFFISFSGGEKLKVLKTFCFKRKLKLFQKSYDLENLLFQDEGNMYKVRFKVASNDSYFTFIFLKIFESNRQHTVFRPLSGFEIWPIHLFSCRGQQIYFRPKPCTDYNNTVCSIYLLSTLFITTVQQNSFLVLILRQNEGVENILGKSHG